MSLPRNGIWTNKKPYIWFTDPDALPPLQSLDIVNYLVFGLSAYTFKS